MAATKPTIVFLHGSWHNPNHFKTIRDVFEKDGYPTECPLQPTYNAKPTPPVLGLEDDVKAIQDLLTKLLDDGKEVIMVLHSYGGVVGTEAVREEFGKKSRQEKGLAGGVLGLLYMCAFVIPVGVSLETAFGGCAPFITIRDNGLCMVEQGEVFYNDLPQEDIIHWKSEMAPVPLLTQTTPITYAAYKYFPVTYLYCTKDQAMPLELQKMMVKSSGVDFKEESCDASHSPFLSMPQTVLDVVKRMKF